jgi:hypothetical protein
MSDVDLGEYVVKAVDGDVTLNPTPYGSYTFLDGVEVDLLSESTDTRVRAWPNWGNAQVMCEDTGFEIAQRIVAGELAVVRRRPPGLDIFF